MLPLIASNTDNWMSNNVNTKQTPSAITTTAVYGHVKLSTSSILNKFRSLFFPIIKYSGNAEYR